MSTPFPATYVYAEETLKRSTFPATTSALVQGDGGTAGKPGVDPIDASRGFHIGTFGGHWFYFKNPRPGDFHIEDIAHALSQNCRYNGHTDRFYSVAEHCVHVSRRADPEAALGGLLHDADEAYLSDIPTPQKWHLDAIAPGVLRDMEETVQKAIFAQYGVPWPMHPSIGVADKRMLYTEMPQLMRYGDMFQTAEGPQPYDDLDVGCWPPESAEREFLARFYQLTN